MWCSSRNVDSCFKRLLSVRKGTDLADQLPTSPRLIKTHLPVQLVPQSFWEQGSRVNATLTVCVARSGVVHKTWLFCRSSTWPVTPRTTPCPISTSAG